MVWSGVVNPCLIDPRLCNGSNIINDEQTNKSKVQGSYSRKKIILIVYYSVDIALKIMVHIKNIFKALLIQTKPIVHINRIEEISPTNK